MIDGVTRLGGLPGLPGRVTLSAGVAFCHVNDSRWGNPPSRGRVHARQSAPKFEQNNMAAHAYKPGELFRRLHLQNVQQSEENQAYSGIVSEEDPMESHTSTVNNFTTQQCLVTSPRDPGVVSLHVNAGQFSTTARRVTSPTWGPPPPCKQALTFISETIQIHRDLK